MTLLGWPALGSRLRLVALDLNLVLARLRLSDVVGGLQAYPSFRRGTEGLSEPYRHFGRHAGAAIDQVRERLTADAEYLRSFGDVQAKRLQTTTSLGKSSISTNR